MKTGELDDEVTIFLAERARRTAVEFGEELGDPPLLEWGGYERLYARAIEELHPRAGASHSPLEQIT